MSRWATLALSQSSRSPSSPPDAATDETGDAKSRATAPIAESGPGEGRAHDLRTGRSTSTRARTGTIAEFEKATGVDVKYVEDINDNDEFFGKIRPLLASRATPAAAA